MQNSRLLTYFLAPDSTLGVFVCSVAEIKHTEKIFFCTLEFRLRLIPHKHDCEFLKQYGDIKCTVGLF